jgi:protein SCO1/2
MRKKHFFIAISILVVPIAIFFVLNQAKHSFTTLPILGERIPPNGTDIQDTIYYQVPSFQVWDQTGKQLTINSFDNSIVIASFFFARCTDVCPTLNRRLKSVYDKMKEYAEVQFVSFSVDPINDSVEVLAEYSKRYEADPNIWHFVTTKNQEDVVKIGQGFLLPVSIEDKTIDHSQQLILMDKSKRIRGFYDSFDDSELKRLTEDIRVLLYEYHKR